MTAAHTGSIDQSPNPKRERWMEMLGSRTLAHGIIEADDAIEQIAALRGSAPELHERAAVEHLRQRSHRAHGLLRLL